MKRTLVILALGGLFCPQAVNAQEWPDSTTQVEHIQQLKLNIAPGQYSGITPIGDGVYAVVHDKSKGGGIHIFTIGFKKSGNISSVQAFEACPPIPVDIKDKDNEGIVFVPETGTLWVSAEADQTIQEYLVDGSPTGRELKIPSEYRKAARNRGFEALAYGDGLFWTTTEAPLDGEECHRILSFSLSTLAPEFEYYYTSDHPEIPDTKGPRAFANGISAMTWLGNGRLAILEREVYVPDDGLFAMSGAFTRNRIYVVEPKREIDLEKQLLTEFYTGPFNFANFEGMCLGPKIGDRQSLLLIADSQDHYMGLADEWVRVILYTP